MSTNLRKKNILLGIFLIEFLAAIDITGVTVLIPKFREVFAINDNYAGLVLLAYLAPFSIFLIPIGWLADKKNCSEKIMILSIFGFLIFSFLCALAPNLISFIIARFLKGFCAAGIFTTEFVIIIKYWEKPRRIVEIIVVGLALGVLIGPLVGALFIDYWRLFFLLGAFLTIFSWINLNQIWKIKPIKRSVDQGSDSVIKFTKEIKKILAIVFWGVVLNFVMAISSQGVNLVITLHLQDTLKQTALLNGVVLSTIALAMMLANLVGLGSKIFKSYQVAAWGGSICFSISVVFLFFTNWVNFFAWIIYIFMGIFYGIVLSTVELMSLTPLKTENLALGNGIVITAMQAGFAVSTFTPMIYLQLGIYSLFVFAFLPIFALIFFLCFCFKQKSIEKI